MENFKASERDIWRCCLLRKESWLIYPQGETQMWRPLTQLFKAPEAARPCYCKNPGVNDRENEDTRIK